MRLSLQYRFEDIVMECGFLSESESDIQVSAGISFEFKPVTVDLSYLSRADAGTSIFSTVTYEFDMPAFVGGIADKAAQKRAEARRFVRAGSISDMVSSVSDRGEKEVWVNFSSEIPFEGVFVITKDNIILARGRVTQRLSSDPFIYEGVVMEHELTKEFKVGDTVAVQQQQVLKYQNEKKKSKEALSSALERRIAEQESRLKTADLMRWDVSSQKEIAARVSGLRKEGNLEECEAKLIVLEKSLTKL
ncbi:MAG: hypothetical protein COZ72_02605, partial [Elusimicrobia bacterium CG_4_8_14_3_um_filter_50_9]